LLGQGEHGPTSPAVLITTSRTLGETVLAEIERLLKTWPTRATAAVAWADQGSVLVARDRSEAIALSGQLAPEHLEIHVDEADLDGDLADLRNCGSLFLGREATVAYGDRGMGTNPVLPTMRAARYTAGLWVGMVLKTCTYQRVTRAGTEQVALMIAAICEAVGFGGHVLIATIRLERAAAAT
jgi:sulfopropanediol 3-dehydrogenase